jgi:CelD/BcsL family acetyltransferase involved in cellulose biosynthesis
VIRLELLDNCDEQVWDDLVAKFEGGTIFHTLAWMRVIEKLKHAEKLPVGIFDGADMVGVLPLFRVRRGPLTILASPLGEVGYGGPLVDEAQCGIVIEQMDSLFKHIGVDYIELRSRESWIPTRLLAQHYIVDELQTCALPISRDLGEMWANLKKECRKAVRKARKNNVEVEEATDKSFIDVYYEMAKDTYSKSNRPPVYSSQDYSIVWDTLRPYDRVKVLLAKHNGQVIAGRILLRFRDQVYDWDAVALPSHFSVRPNNLLVWAVIGWAVDSGVVRFDMMGANIPGIARFKKTFGSKVCAYTYAYKDVTWQAHIGRQMYRWLAPWIRRALFGLRSTGLSGASS